MQSNQQSSKGFYGSLFDLSFQEFITPKVIKVLYVIFLVILALGVLAGLGVAAFGLINGQFEALLVLLVLPIAIHVYLVVGRIYFELLMVAFGVLENLQQIAENTKR